MAKLEDLYSFVLEDTGPYDEYIITVAAHNGRGETLFLPLATHDGEDVPRLSELAQAIGKQQGKKVTLVKFTGRTDISVFNPSVNRV